MAKSEPDPRQQLNEAFERFRAALTEHLEREARESVNGAMAALGVDDGPFQLQDARIEVVVHDLTLTARDAPVPAATPEKPSSRRKAKAKSTGKRSTNAPARRGRTPGPVRAALLALTEEATSALSTEELRTGLASRGVQASADNLHQQLRRLVQSGQLEREGRGLYRRAVNSEQAA